MSFESVMPSNHLTLCRPLLLPPLIFPSIRVFSSELALYIMWPKYWSFSFSISPSNEYSGMISFRMDWLDLLAVQGTLKSLHQHHSWKASILQCSAFFMVQFSHLYVTTVKTIALTRQTFVGKVMSLLFNMLSKFSVAFLPRNNTLEGISSWIPEAEEWKWPGGQNGGNHCHRTVYREKNEKNEDSLRDLWDNIRHTSIYIIEVPEGEERKDLRRYLKR